MIRIKVSNFMLVLPFSILLTWGSEILAFVSKIGLAHPAIDPRISNTGADQLALGQFMFRHRLPPLKYILQIIYF